MRLPAAAAAVLSAFLLQASFPPLARADAAWFALVPLLAALHRAAPRDGFRLGWGTGFLFWLGSLAWLWRLVDNGGPLPLVLLGHVALAAYLALYTGLFGMAVAWLRGGGRLDGRPWGRFWASLLLEPLLWTGAEHLRGVLFTGFPWNGLGISQYRGTGLIQCASWGGVAVVSLLLMAVNGGIAALLEGFWQDVAARRRPPDRTAAGTPAGVRRVPRRLPLRSAELMTAVALTAACWLWGMERLRRVDETVSAAPRWRLVLVHPDAPSFFERDEEGLDVLSGDLLAYAELVAAFAPDLCIWPETTLPGPLPHDESTLALAAAAVAKTGAPLLAGGLEIEPGAERGWEWSAGARCYNAAFLFGTNGAIEAVYRKQHLVPFGEFIPLDKRLPWLTRLSPIGYSCSSGRESTVMAVRRPRPRQEAAPADVLRLSPLICFEDAFPYLSRRALAAGATLLVNLTNDAWFDGSCEPEQHLAQAVFRCVETGLPMVRSANRGVTCAIDAAGRVTRRLGSGRGAGTAGFLVDDVAVPPRPPGTFFTRHGKFLVPLPGTLLLVFVLARASASAIRRRQTVRHGGAAAKQDRIA